MLIIAFALYKKYNKEIDINEYDSIYENRL